ncbi:iron-sulfur cluster biosynthesis family protein [Bacillus norwichensis]|uniref:Iron-sulfur cluster biosynthesis family protein n=1 Tax=Bacillus norwichensis TaxID=2762217 RepID=A0ABR8VQY7_9BACI|nr:iron-sulfur cluster biosynthesis family protein [Bacillus norwichensis]MBD8007186.1 iron-sulfur cluster biosynthesis family protein [Bacillus norwichensis]
MLITLTESALKKLELLDIKEGKLPRIDADVRGGCGISVSFRFIIDDPRKNDYMVKYNGIKIGIDRFTFRNLGDVTEIDYTEENGFIVGDHFSSGACAIEFNHKF